MRAPAIALSVAILFGLLVSLATIWVTSQGQQERINQRLLEQDRAVETLRGMIDGQREAERSASPTGASAPNGVVRQEIGAAANTATVAEQLEALTRRMEDLERRTRSVRELPKRPAVWPELVLWANRAQQDYEHAMREVLHMTPMELVEKFGSPDEIDEEDDCWRFSYYKSGTPDKGGYISFLLRDGWVVRARSRI